ncbi:hypothetical protein F0562_010453 [Nyssa sinensis]|uniref:Uncharacterized protein n=1 Tax=Nyssa sinensis TaxID=561372 RepID=A0A5J5A4B5_9ASTE|nr:hypothetical protein F0562_010453 [Nyssa sinensis]
MLSFHLTRVTSIGILEPSALPSSAMLAQDAQDKANPPRAIVIAASGGQPGEGRHIVVDEDFELRRHPIDA